MSEQLPCPLCGHLNDKPTHHSNFKCASKACRQWLELPKGQSSLKDYTARKAAEQAKSDDWWEAETQRRMSKYGFNYIEARDHIHAEHDRNKQKMASAKATKAPTALSATPTPQTIVSRVISTDDTTEAPW
jgi:Sec7-like guanine-nucleotide exchange factor